jgi:ABC-type bacteriocin/lantibiotic exporter with double-glycine peptidase domain
MFKKIFYILEDKKKILYINFIYLIIALIELIGINFITLFVGNALLKNKDDKFNITNIDFFKTIDTKLIILILILIITIRFIFFIYGNYIIKKYILDLNKSLKIKFLQAFLSSNNNIINDKNDKSDQLTLFSQKIDHFTIQIIDYFIRLFANLLILLAIFGFLLFTEKLITLYLVSLSLIFFILYHFTFSKFIKRLSEGYYLNFTSNIKNFLNIIYNAIQIKLYQRNDIFIENSEKWISRSNKDSLKFYIIQIFPRQLLEFLVILFILIIYFFIQGQVENKTVIIFYSTIFLVAFYRMMPPFLFLIDFFNNLRFFSNPINDLFKYLSIKNNNKITKKKMTIDNIKIQKLYYEYDKNNKILKNINININRNDVIGIFGNSGSGKTTLLKLILGLQKIQQGKILINSKKVQTISKEIYWKNFSYIPQNSILLDGNLHENITLTHDKNINIDKLIKSIKFTDLNNKLKLSDKNNYNKENLSKISGGEIQRISISRAIYFDRPIFILDESTNALDKKNQKFILQKIKKIKDKIIFIVTHDRSVLKICNKIIYL